MPTQPDLRRLTTICEQQPSPQAQVQHRWSAPAQPTASLIQNGHIDLGSPPERPLRAPAYPLSMRPLLDQQDSVQRSSSNHNTSKQTSQLPVGMLAWIRQVLTGHPVSPPRPSISYPIVPPDNTPVDQFENPRPAPLPPTLSRPTLSPATLSPSILPPRTPSPPPYSPLDEALINRIAGSNSHAPANRRPLSVPPPVREFSSPFATDFPDARHWCSRRTSLQLGRFALCSACHRVRHCITRLGAGRMVCNECFREYFLDGKE